MKPDKPITGDQWARLIEATQKIFESSQYMDRVFEELKDNGVHERSLIRMGFIKQNLNYLVREIKRMFDDMMHEDETAQAAGLYHEDKTEIVTPKEKDPEWKRGQKVRIKDEDHTRQCGLNGKTGEIRWIGEDSLGVELDSQPGDPVTIWAGNLEQI